MCGHRNSSAPETCGDSSPKTGLTDPEHLESAIRQLVREANAEVGDRYFPALVRSLGGILGLDWTFIGEFHRDTRRIEVKALWADGQVARPFDYSLEGTPCETVVGRRSCAYPSGVAERFPQDVVLAKKGFDAYVGVPLWSTREEPLGLLVGLRRSPLTTPNLVQSLFELFAARTAAEIERVGSLEALERSYEETLAVLVDALELRDRDTSGHSLRVVRHAVQLAEALGLDEAEQQAVRWGSVLHDVGKIAVPDAILCKPDRLTEEEMEAIRCHPEAGYQLLRSVNFLRPALDVVRHHHERWDGGGYPHGLAGEDIPLSARIFAVVDTFDAMTSDRSYRKAGTTSAAREEIARCAGSQFDPDVVRVFLDKCSTL